MLAEIVAKSIAALQFAALQSKFGIVVGRDSNWSIDDIDSNIDIFVDKALQPNSDDGINARRGNYQCAIILSAMRDVYLKIPVGFEWQKEIAN